MSTVTTYFLIIPAHGTPRIVQRYPHSVPANCIAYRLRVYRPDGWGRIAPQELDITVPEQAPTDVTVVDIGGGQ